MPSLATIPLSELGPETLLHDPQTLSSTVKAYMSKQSTDKLLHGFPNEPIRIKVEADGSLKVVDGNHRVSELYQRYLSGQIPASTPVPYEPYTPTPWLGAFP